ncbi:MAG: serine/threonine-protein kinase [Pseudomonadota bacterium]
MTTTSDPRATIKSSVGIGDVLNGIFQIKRFVAGGGMGEVFEGVNINTDEIVAIKIMAPAFAQDERVEAMFRNEARILTKLAHPALVQYRVLAREPSLNLLYIVMDYIDGVSLSDVIDSIGATTNEIIALARRLAVGLREAHKFGAIHRDLSPDNVLLERGRLERARIVDFGIAKNLNPAEGLVTIEGFSGKIGFAAPEQLGDFGGSVGPWTDVYGLGLLILSLSLGRKFDFGNVAEEAIERRRKPIDLSLVQPELRPLLQAMLVADPASRLRSMDAVLEALDESNYQKTLFALPGSAFLPAGQAALPETPIVPRPMSLVQQITISSAAAEKARIVKRRFVTVGAAMAAIIGGGWWYYAGVSADKHNLIAAKTAMASENCAWLNIDHSLSNAMVIRGAANDPAAVRASVSSAMGGKIVVDVAAVGSLDPAACALVDAIRTMRSEKNLLTTAQSNYQMRLDGAPTLPGKIAARTLETIDIGGGGKPFAVYAVLPDGNISWLMDRNSIPAMVKDQSAEMLGTDRVRLRLDVEREGWTGLLVIAGQEETLTKLWTVPIEARTKAWYDKLATEGAKNGWRADMVWFSTASNAKT